LNEDALRIAAQFLQKYSKTSMSIARDEGQAGFMMKWMKDYWINSQLKAVNIYDGNN
jgi:hypothetical protein